MRRLFLLFALTACGGGLGGAGTGDEGDECSSTADCESGLACAGVNDGPVCGIGPREECFDDSACFESVCHATFDPCSSDFIGSHCAPPCTADAECGQGFACDAGHCIARPCDDGFTCAGREECDPGRIAATAPVFDRHHGCFAVACATDAECGERFCVNGTCQDAAGTCAEPIAVP